MSGINKWAEDVHDLARAKGWWDEALEDGRLNPEIVKNLVPIKLNLMHDEISEASSDARRDDWDLYWELPLDGQPNVCVRISRSQIHELVTGAERGDETSLKALSNLTRMLGMGPGAYEATKEENKPAFAMDVMRILSSRHKPGGFPFEVVDNIIRSLDLLHTMGYDTESLMQLKHAYNKTRPYRHGNKRF